MNQQLITALYCRLSIEDDNDGDSNSIQNQRLLQSTYANEQKFPNQRFFVDDGYTGTNFNRPAMQELLHRHGKVQLMQTDYATFRGCRNLRSRPLSVKEYLFLLEK